MAAKAPKANYLRVSALMLSLQLLSGVFYSVFVFDRSVLRYSGMPADIGITLRYTAEHYSVID